MIPVPTPQTLKAHGITADEFVAMWEAQCGECAVCGKAFRTAHIDHDHRLAAKYGRRYSVRGLLCPWCNRMVGVLKDSIETAAGIARYLSNPPAHLVLDRTPGDPAASPSTRRRKRARRRQS